MVGNVGLLRRHKKLAVAEMRMLRWIYGLTLLDKVKNDVIRSKVGFVLIEEKLRETRFRWFGHVKRRDPDAPSRRCEKIVLGASMRRRDRRRPRKRWGEVIKQDLAMLLLAEDMALDRRKWRSRIRVDERVQGGVSV